jgi:hypothetical protein
VGSTEVSSYKKKKNPYNIWQETIKFFNTKINQEVTRKEFFDSVNRFGRYNLNSRDTYRLLLQKAGFLESIGRGKYQVLKQIPNVSLTEMTDFVNQYYKPMGWFKYWNGLEYYLDLRRRMNDSRRTI